jgi:bifunctional oligoribonuclease and PAP phosphatase NrnA
VHRSFEAARYWGQGLAKLHHNDHIVWTSLTQEDRKAADYTGNDDADLINILSTIEDANIAIIFVEQHGGKVKVSWRAIPGLEVAQVAFSFGGGGHAAASGAEIEGTLEDIQQRVLKATAELATE